MFLHKDYKLPILYLNSFVWVLKNVAPDLKLPTFMSIYLKLDIKHKINTIITNHLILIKILYI